MTAVAGAPTSKAPNGLPRDGSANSLSNVANSGSLNSRGRGGGRARGRAKTISTGPGRSARAAPDPQSRSRMSSSSDTSPSTSTPTSPHPHGSLSSTRGGRAANGAERTSPPSKATAPAPRVGSAEWAAMKAAENAAPAAKPSPKPSPAPSPPPTQPPSPTTVLRPTAPSFQPAHSPETLRADAPAFQPGRPLASPTVATSQPAVEALAVEPAAAEAEAVVDAAPADDAVAAEEPTRLAPAPDVPSTPVVAEESAEPAPAVESSPDAAPEETMAQSESAPTVSGTPRSEPSLPRSVPSRPSMPLSRSSGRANMSPPPISPPLERPLSMPLDLSLAAGPEPVDGEDAAAPIESATAAVAVEDGEDDHRPYSSFSLLPAPSVDDVLERAMQARGPSPDASPVPSRSRSPSTSDAVAVEAEAEPVVEAAEEPAPVGEPEVVEEQPDEVYTPTASHAPLADDSPSPPEQPIEPIVADGDDAPGRPGELSVEPPESQQSSTSASRAPSEIESDAQPDASLRLSPEQSKSLADELAAFGREPSDGMLAVDAAEPQEPAAMTPDESPSTAGEAWALPRQLRRNDEASDDELSDDDDRKVTRPAPPEQPPSLTLSIFSRAGALVPFRHRLFAIAGSVAINLILPFVNGVMLGFGEIFAREWLATTFGFGVSSRQARPAPAGGVASVGLRHAPVPGHAAAKTAAEAAIEVATDTAIQPLRLAAAVVGPVGLSAKSTVAGTQVLHGELNAYRLMCAADDVAREGITDDTQRETVCYTDHQNSVNWFAQAKLKSWKPGFWRSAGGSEAKEAYEQLTARPWIKLEWTRGHQTDDSEGTRLNQRADASCTAAHHAADTHVGAVTWQMEDYTFWSAELGHIEGNMKAYVERKMAEKTLGRLSKPQRARVDHSDPLLQTFTPNWYVFAKAKGSYSVRAQWEIRSNTFESAERISGRLDFDNDAGPNCPHCPDVEETERHVMVECARTQRLRDAAAKSLQDDVERLLGMADSGLDTAENVQRLKTIAADVFRDADRWPDARTVYYMGKVPLIEASILGGDAQARRRAVSRIASNWNTVCIRLAGRLQSTVRSDRFKARQSAERAARRAADPDVPA